MSKPRYNIEIYGSRYSDPIQLKETALRMFRLHEVHRSEVDLFRLHFDTTASMDKKFDVLKQWVTIISSKGKTNV